MTNHRLRNKFSIDRPLSFVAVMAVLLAMSFTVASAQSSLVDLQLSVGQLAQPFSPSSVSYFAVVPETEQSLALVPVAADDEAVIAVSINGEKSFLVKSGESTPALGLEIGTNVIVVDVTSGQTTHSYRITVPKRAVRFQQGVGGYRGVADTQILQAVKYVDYNLGAQHKYEVGYSGPWARDQKYVLIRFDDLDIPEEAIITEASVNLYFYGDRVSSGYEIVAPNKEVYMHRIRIPWTEGTGGNESTNDGSPANPGEVTWNTFMGEAAAFHFEVLDSAIVGVEPNWYSFELTDLANSWLTGALPNYGVLFKTYEFPSNGDDRMNGTKQFRSSEYSVVEERPYLSVTYSMPLAGVTLDAEALILNAGESRTLTAFPRPLNAVYDTIEWSSSNESVVKVSGGVATAVGKGDAVIKVAISNGSENVTAEAKVTVE